MRVYQILFIKQIEIINFHENIVTQLSIIRYNSRRGSRGGGGLDTPGIFKIYISENQISRFFALSGLFCVCISKFFWSLRLPAIIYR